jgi:hypothetical protein
MARGFSIRQFHSVMMRVIRWPTAENQLELGSIAGLRADAGRTLRIHPLFIPRQVSDFSQK